MPTEGSGAGCSEGVCEWALLGAEVVAEHGINDTRANLEHRDHGLLSTAAPVEIPNAILTACRCYALRGEHSFGAE